MSTVYPGAEGLYFDGINVRRQHLVTGDRQADCGDGTTVPMPIAVTFNQHLSCPFLWPGSRNSVLHYQEHCINGSIAVTDGVKVSNWKDLMQRPRPDDCSLPLM